MAEIDEVVTDSPATEPVSPLDDLSGAFARYSEASADEPKSPKEATPKETPAPAVAPPAPPQGWEKIAREAQDRAAQLERELASRPAVAAPAVADDPPPPKEAGEDPRWQEVRDLQFVDPGKSLAIQRAILADEARAIAAEEFDRRASATEREKRAQASIEAATSVVGKIAADYGVTPKIAETMMQNALRHIAAAAESMKNDGLWLMAENYEIAVRAEYGEPPPRAEAASVPPPPAVVADPPGAKGSAAPVQRRIAAVPPLSPETNRSVSSLASSVGLSAEGTERLRQRVAGKA